MKHRQSKISETPAEGSWATQQPLERADLGARLKSLRLERNWSLADAGAAMGIARSTLSKIENGAMSPTFDLLQKICIGLNIDIAELFFNHRESPPVGMRTVTRYREGPTIVNDNYVHEMLAHEISPKKLLPFRTTVRRKHIGEFGKIVGHRGEVILVVTKGEIEFHSEFYAPLALKTGDSIYFDSKMAHALISLSDEDAEILWVCEN